MPSSPPSIREGQGKIFGEDLRCSNASSRTLRYPERGLLKLNIDAGGVQSRQIIDRLLAAEQAATASGPADRLGDLPCST